ncbi:MAG: VWA domain-containing protein [Nannocystaceae bacterium]|nr:VWA domain-containing protein [Nannocystaceae bacterium]
MERWTLAAGHMPPLWTLGLLTLVVVVAISEAAWTFTRPRATRPRRIGLAILALRLVAVLALVGLTLEVTLRIEQVTPSGRRVVVLVDRSASMALADAEVTGGATTRRQTRAEAVWKASSDARVAWRDDGIVLDVRTFDLSTHPLAGELAETLTATPDGAASDLAGALSELAQPGRRETTPLAGVVVISDGLVASDDAADGHVQTVAQSLGVPITTVATGAPAIIDVSVANVRAGEFAFVENVVEFEAAIVAHGLAGAATTVQLRRDGELVSETRIRLPADGIQRDVHFEVAPDRVGQFVYEIVVPGMEGEATQANNRRAFVVKVLRDKVRVLHVAGRPDWDVRALRSLLRRDPNVELLSYYILRGIDDISREDTTAPLSLIPFPTEELFEEQLGSFDLVILHNFDAVRHHVGQYVDNMARYVLEGGALVLIGGDLGLADGGYATPAMAAVMPIDSRDRAGLTEGRFRPGLTDAGRRHPITAWLAAAEGTSWEALPELSDFNRLSMTSRPATIGASALLVHPDDSDASGQPRPILAVAEPGRGRTMVLATGSTWRLGFAPDLPLIDGARPYDLLWLGAVRWLLRDDSSGRLRLETDRPRYRVGETVELRVETATASYSPEPAVDVTWSVRRLDASSAVATDDDAPDPSAAPPLRGGEWTTDGLGRARESLQALPVGAYEAIARRTPAADETDTHDDTRDDTSDDGRSALSQHESRRVFIVEPPGRELARVDADPGTDRLRRLAEAAHGEALSVVAGDTLPRALPLADPSNLLATDGMRVDTRRDVPLWNGWLALVVLVGAFGGEWLVRRRHGEL